MDDVREMERREKREAMGFDPYARIRELEAALSAAEARGRAAGQWQPIETCPSDGRSIIVFGGRFDLPAVTQADGDWWNSKVGQTLGSRPTYWQPLPTPPEPPALDVADRTEGGL